MKLHKQFIFIFILLAFLGTFFAHKSRAPKRNYSDFHCFYTAGKRILEHKNIYVIRDKETAEFRYAPIFAVFMSGLALMDEDTADSLWFIFNFSLFILSFMLMKKMVAGDKLDFGKSALLYFLVILGVSRLIQHNFDNGQTNILMLASIIAGLYFINQKKEITGAALLAISVMIKYTPLIFIPYFLFGRRIKTALLISGFVVIYLILPAFFIGFKTNFEYIKNMIPFLTQSTVLDPMTILDPMNQSLLSFVHRLFTNCIAYFYAPHMPFQSLNLKPQAINLIFILLAAVLYLLALNRPKNINRKNNSLDQADYAMLLICAILFNLNAWKSGYVFSSYAFFVIIYYLMKEGRDWFLLTVLLLSYGIHTITIVPLLGKTLNYKLYFYSPFTLQALFLFAALLKIKFFAKKRLTLTNPSAPASPNHN